MPGQVEERAMSEAEQEYFRSCAQTQFDQIKLDVLKDLTLWGIILLLMVVAWLAVSWLARQTIGSEALRDGAATFDSVVAPWVSGFAAAIVPVILVILLVLWFKRLFDSVWSVRVDLEKKRVVEEKYEFSAAMRMQTPKHRCLIYFLHSNDGTVLVLFDYESQDLGTNGEDPLTSSFRPQTRLTLVRAAKSMLVIGTNFSGDVLDAGDPLDLMAPPDEWPVFEEICDIPWQELEARLCR